MTEPRYLFVFALSTLYYYCFLFSYVVSEPNYWAFDFIWLLYFGGDWVFVIEDVVIVRGDRCSFLFRAAVCSVDSLCLCRFKTYSTFFLL